MGASENAKSMSGFAGIGREEASQGKQRGHKRGVCSMQGTECAKVQPAGTACNRHLWYLSSVYASGL